MNVRGLTALTIVLLAAGSLPIPVASATLEATSGPTPDSLTLEVGAQFPHSSQSSTSVSLRVTNSGPDTFVTVSATDPVPNYVYVNEPFGSFNLPSGASADVTLVVFARANSGSSRGTYQSIITASASDGRSVQFPSLSITVNDYRSPRLELVETQTVTHTMPCPIGFDPTYATFDIVVTNSGDYSVSASLAASVSSYTAQPLQGSTFQVGAGATVTRRYQIEVRGDADDRIYPGTMSVSSHSGISTNDFGTLNFEIKHPVELVLPTQSGRHDFGEVELMRPPPNPWSHPVEERCGYKAGSVKLEGVPPNYVIVEPDPLFVPAGGAALLSVTPRFNSTHSSLLLTPQDFQVKFLTNGATNPSYDFRATPSFISVKEVKERLLALSTESPLPQGQEAAKRTRDLLINRTEVRRPTTPSDLEDAGRIVSLAEPVILAIEQFEQMARWNTEGRFDATVETLSVLAAGLDALRSVCNGVVAPADRTECLAILTILESTMTAFAGNARSHFEDLTRSGGTELDELRAAEGLALALDALGDEEGAATFTARADQHFENFTARLAAADRHRDNVDARVDELTPGGFVATDAGYVAWHPFGLVFLESFRSYSSSEYALARAELTAAGEENRLRDLDQEAEAVEANLAAGRVLTLVVTAAYAAFVLLVVFRLGRAFLRRRSDRKFSDVGDVVLGRAPPLI